MKKLDVKTMVTCAALIAAAIVLSRFLSINAWNLKIGFTFVPVFLAAYLYGFWVVRLSEELQTFWEQHCSRSVHIFQDLLLPAC